MVSLYDLRDDSRVSDGSVKEGVPDENDICEGGDVCVCVVG